MGNTLGADVVVGRLLCCYGGVTAVFFTFSELFYEFFLDLAPDFSPFLLEDVREKFRRFCPSHAQDGCRS